MPIKKNSNITDIPYYHVLSNTSKIKNEKTLSKIIKIVKDEKLFFPVIEKIETIYYIREDKKRADFESARRLSINKHENFRNFIIIDDGNKYTINPDTKSKFHIAHKQSSSNETPNDDIIAKKEIENIITENDQIIFKIDIDKEAKVMNVKMLENNIRNFSFETMDSIFVSFLKKIGIKCKVSRRFNAKKENHLKFVKTTTISKL